MNKKLLLIIQVVVSLVILFFLVRLVDWSHMAKIWRGINYNYIFLLVLLITADRILMAYKWFLLLKKTHPTVTLGDAIKAYYVGTLFGLFMPVSLGADVVKMLHLHISKKEGAALASSVLMEKVLGFIAAIVIAVFSMTLLTFVFHLDVHILMDIAVILLFSLLLILFISLRRGLLGYIKKILGPSRGRFRKKLGSVYDTYRKYNQAKPLLSWFLILSCLEQLLPVVGNYLTADALGLKLPFLYFLAIIPVVQLFTRLPISLNGLGINEGLLIYFFHLLALPSAYAFSIGILQQICLAISLLPALLFWRPSRYLKPGQDLPGAIGPAE